VYVRSGGNTVEDDDIIAIIQLVFDVCHVYGLLTILLLLLLVIFLHVYLCNLSICCLYAVLLRLKHVLELMFVPFCLLTS